MTNSTEAPPAIPARPPGTLPELEDMAAFLLEQETKKDQPALVVMLVNIARRTIQHVQVLERRVALQGAGTVKRLEMIENQIKRLTEQTAPSAPAPSPDPPSVSEVTSAPKTTDTKPRRSRAPKKE